MTLVNVGGWVLTIEVSPRIMHVYGNIDNKGYVKLLVTHVL